MDEDGHFNVVSLKDRHSIREYLLEMEGEHGYVTDRQEKFDLLDTEKCYTDDEFESGLQELCQRGTMEIKTL